MSGESNKATLTDLYCLEEIPPFMCAGGGKVRGLDLKEYLWETNFDKAFDERAQP